MRAKVPQAALVAASKQCERPWRGATCGRAAP